MDTSDPLITFDENGISNHYHDYHANVLPNWKNTPEGYRELQSKINSIKSAGKGKDFDCILGLSGGLDSSYMLHKVVTEFGLRPLVFHVDGGWNSEVAVQNISSLVNKLGLDLYTEVVNWKEMKKFQLAMFKAGVPHLDTPQDLAFIAVLYKFASKYNIKHILNGGNISTECVLMPLKYIYWATDPLQVSHILRNASCGRLRKFPTTNIFYHKVYLRYFKNISVFKPLNYMNFTKRSAEAELSKAYGWLPYPQKHFESRFTRFFEGYWLLRRFGYDMRRNQFSSLILTGQMTRDEALKRLESPPLDEASCSKEFKYICDKLDISETQLMNYFDMPLRFYWDYQNLSQLFDVGSTILSRLTGARRFGAY